MTPLRRTVVVVGTPGELDAPLARRLRSLRRPLRAEGVHLWFVALPDRAADPTVRIRPVRVAGTRLRRARHRAGIARLRVLTRRRPAPILVAAGPASLAVPAVAEQARRARCHLLLDDPAVPDWLPRSLVDTVITSDRSVIGAVSGWVDDVRLLPAAGGTVDDVRRAVLPLVRVYGIYYEHLDILERSVRSIRDHAGLDLRIYVAENHSATSEANRPHLRDLVDRGTIDGHVLFATNTYGSGVEAAFREHFPPSRSDDVVVFTDLDLVVPGSGRGWAIDALDRLDRFPELVAVGVDLDLANWDPAVAPGHLVAPASSWSDRYGIHRARLGFWLLTLRRTVAEEYLDGTNVCADRPLFDHLHRTWTDPVYGRMPLACAHLSWDLAPDSAYVTAKRADFYTNVYERQPTPVASIWPERPGGAP